LIALSVLLSASEARAQMTVDVAKITCRQYLFDRNFSPRVPMIANWLSGYFNGQKNNTGWISAPWPRTRIKSRIIAA
jgi:HdeA/HdeB family